MKLPASLARGALTLVAPALRRDDVNALAQRGWRSARLPRVLADIAVLRAHYAWVRAMGDGLDIAGAAWCCAMDPVRLAADMRDVRLSSWPVESVDPDQAEALRAAVATLLAEDPDPRLRQLELIAAAPSRWYLVGVAEHALDFSVTPADLLVGHVLRNHKPVGPDGPVVQRLTTEVQMLSHAHGAALSGIWPHGPGGRPSIAGHTLPTLVSDDPFWRSCWALAAPDADVLSFADAPLSQGGQTWAPSTEQVADALARIDTTAGIRHLHVVTGDGMASFARGGWRSWFSGARR